MPTSSGGHVESSSDCVTRPKAREIGLTGYAVPIQPSLHIGRYVMATAEHREPCDSRGSCTVLGAPGGEIPPGDSTTANCLYHRAVVSSGVDSRPPAVQSIVRFGTVPAGPAYYSRSSQPSNSMLGCASTTPQD